MLKLLLITFYQANSRENKQTKIKYKNNIIHIYCAFMLKSSKRKRSSRNQETARGHRFLSLSLSGRDSQGDRWGERTARHVEDKSKSNGAGRQRAAILLGAAAVRQQIWMPALFLLSLSGGCTCCATMQRALPSQLTKTTHTHRHTHTYTLAQKQPNTVQNVFCAG